jgi:translation initiation factor 4E
MLRPNELPSSSDYHLFKEGVKPMWEVHFSLQQKSSLYKPSLQDEANKAGGKWIVRLKKGLASKFWEDLV